MRKFGCKPEYDEKSRKFPVSLLLGGKVKEPRSYTWKLDPVVMLDQGSQGSCVGHGWAHELLARPAAVKGVTHDKAVDIYYDAQRLDQWEGGEYQAALTYNEGSSVLAGAKATMITGFIGGYYWAFTFNDFLLALSYRGPAVVGTDWYRNMNTPGVDGMIHASSSVLGGHCYLVCGINVKTRILTIVNSWGSSWGLEGKAYISFDDMEMLLATGGVACFASRRKTSAA